MILWRQKAVFSNFYIYSRVSITRTSITRMSPSFEQIRWHLENFLINSHEKTSTIRIFPSFDRIFLFLEGFCLHNSNFPAALCKILQNLTLSFKCLNIYVWRRPYIIQMVDLNAWAFRTPFSKVFFRSWSLHKNMASKKVITDFFS